MFVIDGGDLNHKLGMMNRVFAVPNYNDLLPSGYELMFTGARNGLWHGNDLEGLLPQRLHRALDLMSVRFYAFDQSIRWSERVRALLPPGLAPPHGSSYVLERTSAVPRAYVVQRAHVERDPELALAILMAPNFDPSSQVVTASRISSGASPVFLSAISRLSDSPCQTEPNRHSFVPSVIFGR